MLLRPSGVLLAKVHSMPGATPQGIAFCAPAGLRHGQKRGSVKATGWWQLSAHSSCGELIHQDPEPEASEKIMRENSSHLAPGVLELKMFWGGELHVTSLNPESCRIVHDFFFFFCGSGD